MIYSAATPILSVNIKDDVDIAELEKFCLKTEQEDKGINLSNKGGYHSKNVVIGEEKEKIIGDLLDAITKAIMDYCGKLEIALPKEIKQMWVNVGRYKDSHILHNHAPFYLSGVVYAHTEDSIDFGKLVFCPANEVAMKDWSTQGGNVREYIKPESGQLIIFPSWASHFVEPNMDKDRNRISLSFNIQ